MSNTLVRDDYPNVGTDNLCSASSEARLRIGTNAAAILAKIRNLPLIKLPATASPPESAHRLATLLAYWLKPAAGFSVLNIPTPECQPYPSTYDRFHIVYSARVADVRVGQMDAAA